MEKLTEVRIPFCGFYESLASSIAEGNAFNAWPDRKDQSDPSELTDDEANKFWDWQNDHYKEFEMELVGQYIAKLWLEINVNTGVDLLPDVNSINIDSPRQYNYTTDRLFVKFDSKALIDLYNKTDKELLAGVIKDQFTSGDGFSSFYNNDIISDEWSDPEQYDHNQWCAVIDAVIIQYEIRKDELLMDY